MSPNYVRISLRRDVTTLSYVRPNVSFGVSIENKKRGMPGDGGGNTRSMCMIQVYVKFDILMYCKLDISMCV